ncbi:MAG: hypothetical protein ACFFBD_12045 [Candidatus Hodarchaeota archaeon]
MSNPVVTILGVCAFICLGIVSFSLFRIYIRVKELPPLLMALAYSIITIVDIFFFVDYTFTPPPNFLGLYYLFNNFALLLLPLSPAFMWLFKLEVFDNGLRANQIRLVIYGVLTALYIFILALVILGVEFSVEFSLVIIILALGLMSYALGTLSSKNSISLAFSLNVFYMYGVCYYCCYSLERF